MDHKLVTELTPTCQLGVAAGNRSVSGEEAAPTPAQRLEDVEKVVRRLDMEVDALVECCTELLERLAAAGVPYVVWE